MKLFPQTTRKVQIVNQTSGDTDVDYRDSVDVSDQLAGTLGPVNAEDSVDASDELNVSSFDGQDSLDATDELAPITELVADDSTEVSDTLSGTLGPVNAQDSTDLADTMHAGPFNSPDSTDLADAPDTWGGSTLAQDSVAINARLSNIYKLDDESMSVADDPAIGPLPTQDSTDVSDMTQVGAFYADGGDTAAIGDAPDTWLASATTPESVSVGSKPVVGNLPLADSAAVDDKRSPVTFSGTLWPNTQVSRTGFDTSPANAIDTDAGTAANTTASSSGGLFGGTNSNTINVDYIVSCADPNLSDWTITDVTLEWSVSGVTTGPSPMGQSINVAFQYSLNDGSSWTTFHTVNTFTVSTSTLSLGALSATQVNQMRFRAVGSVVSGNSLTTAVTAAINWFYTRAVITASKTY